MHKTRQFKPFNPMYLIYTSISFFIFLWLFTKWYKIKMKNYHHDLWGESIFSVSWFFREFFLLKWNITSIERFKWMKNVIYLSKTFLYCDCYCHSSDLQNFVYTSVMFTIKCPVSTFGTLITGSNQAHSSTTPSSSTSSLGLTNLPQLLTAAAAGAQGQILAVGPQVKAFLILPSRA